jgi:hypothetical protein
VFIFFGQFYNTLTTTGPLYDTVSSGTEALEDMSADLLCAITIVMSTINLPREHFTCITTKYLHLKSSLELQRALL